jgi:hypothetical protein
MPTEFFHLSVPQNSWNFSPRGAIREGDLLYGWLPSEHMMQRLIKLLGNASLGTNSPEVMLSQKPIEIFSLKKKKTRIYHWILQKLVKGQDLHPYDKKIKSRFKTLWEKIKIKFRCKHTKKNSVQLHYFKWLEDMMVIYNIDDNPPHMGAIRGLTCVCMPRYL